MPYRDLFRKILFCTDFNTDALPAFRCALNIAAANKDSEIVIYHAIPEPDAQFWKSYINEIEDVEEKARKDIDRKIAEVYLPAIPEGVKWSSRCSVGNVAEEIIAESLKDDVDLIVIGRGRGPNVINRMLGNFTEKVVRAAHCPVLVVPEEAV